MYTVKLKGYVTHNDVYYGPGAEAGDVISGLSEKEKEHLVNAGVVEDVEKDKKDKKGKKEAIDITEIDVNNVVALSELTVPQLKELAKHHEIEGYDNLKKDELIAALTAGDE